MYTISEDNEIFFDGLKLDEFILRDDFEGLTPEEIRDAIGYYCLSSLNHHLIDINYKIRVDFPRTLIMLEGYDDDESYIKRINISIDHIDEIIDQNIYLQLKAAYASITEFNEEFGDRKFNNANVNSLIHHVKSIRHSLNRFGEKSIELIKEVLNTPFCNPKDIFAKLSELFGVNYPLPEELNRRLQELGDSDEELYEKANLTSLNGKLRGPYDVLRMTKEEYFNSLKNERDNKIGKARKK
jgi:hypothetical protein